MYLYSHKITNRVFGCYTTVRLGE